MANVQRLVSIACGAAALALAVPAPSFAQARPPASGPYAQISFGGQFLRGLDSDAGAELHYNAGLHIGVAAGYRFVNGLRLEGEFTWGHSSLDRTEFAGAKTDVDGSFSLYSGLVNAFYDLRTNSNFTPYIGVGVGIVHRSSTDATIAAGPTTFFLANDGDTSFTLHGEVGVGIAVAPNVELVPAYRYQGTTDGSDGVDSNRAHIVKLGLRWNF